MFIDRKEGKVETNASKRQERFLEKQQESCTTSKTFTQLGLIKTRDQRCNLKDQKVSYMHNLVPLLAFLRDTTITSGYYNSILILIFIDI